MTTIETQWRFPVFLAPGERRRKPPREKPKPEPKAKKRIGCTYYYKKRDLWGAFELVARQRVKHGEFKTEEEARSHLMEIGLASVRHRKEWVRPPRPIHLRRYTLDHKRVRAAIKKTGKRLGTFLREHGINTASYYRWKLGTTTPYKFLLLLATNLGGDPLSYARVDHSTSLPQA
jgi:hypothetical protein